MHGSSQQIFIEYSILFFKNLMFVIYEGSIEWSTYETLIIFYFLILIDLVFQISEGLVTFLVFLSN